MIQALSNWFNRPLTVRWLARLERWLLSDNTKRTEPGLLERDGYYKRTVEAINSPTGRRDIVSGYEIGEGYGYADGKKMGSTPEEWERQQLAKAERLVLKHHPDGVLLKSELQYEPVYVMGQSAPAKHAPTHAVQGWYCVKCNMSGEIGQMHDCNSPNE